MKKNILFLCLLLVSLQSFSQIENYGGSASVKVKNTRSGETRWISVVTGAFDGCRTNSDAEKKLNAAINTEKKYDEEMITRPDYQTEEFRNNVDGSASVRVRAKDGSTRVIIAELGRFDQKGIFAAKRSLLSALKSKMNYNEVFAEPVEYNL